MNNNKSRDVKFPTLILFCCWLALANSAYAAQPLVIILSWDGMRWDFPDKGNFPGLKRVELEGVRAKSLTPVFPSSTFPAHVSLATGAPPVIHGIIDNKFFDRNKGAYRYDADANWLEAEPVWITAERQGIKAATFFWVGSETDWRGSRSTYRITPFSDAVSEKSKVSQILRWIDLPLKQRPGLIMSYWSGTDSVAHNMGPEHPDVIRTIKAQDKQLQRLLGAIDDRDIWMTTTLIIVSDHGMTEVNRSAEVKTAIKKSGLDVRIEGGNAVQHLFLKNPSDEPALLTLLAKNQNIIAYRKADVLKKFKFAYPERTGDVVVTTEPPYTLASISSVTPNAINGNNGKFGDHGYLPKYPDMGGIFFAMGNHIDNNTKLGSVNQLDVAPTITWLLGIDAPLHSTGRAIGL